MSVRGHTLFRVRKSDEPFSLEKCLRKAESYDNQYLELNIEAVRRHNNRESARREIEDFLSKKSVMDFSAVNPHSKQLWTHALLNTYLEHKVVDRRDEALEHDIPDSKFGLVTYCHRGWCFSDKDIQFNLKQAIQKVRNTMPQMSYIARFEVAYYVNEYWGIGDKRGNLLCFHCHAIVWAPTTYGLRKIRKAYSRRFDRVLGGASGINVSALKSQADVAKALLYTAKMPLKGYRTNSGNGRPKQEEAKLSKELRHRLFCAMQDIDLRDFWFGGGEGAEILKDTRRQIYQEQGRNMSGPRGLSEQRYRDLVRMNSFRPRTF